MEIDIANVIGAVRREVGERTYEGRRVRAVVASRRYDADIDDVWDALTNRERIPRWFLPIEGDLRLGGHYQLEGNAGGTITACEPPRHLAVTWENGGEVSWVEVRLSEDGGGDGDSPGTLLRLEHLAEVDDERWGEFGPGAVGVGWELALLGLHLHVSRGAAAAAGVGADLRSEGEAWSASDGGREYMRRSSEDWGRASIAAGTPEEAARAAADRTTAFYTGAPAVASGGESGGAEVDGQA